MKPQVSGQVASSKWRYKNERGARHRYAVNKWPGFSARLKVAASVVVNEIRRHMFSFD